MTLDLDRICRLCKLIRMSKPDCKGEPDATSKPGCISKTDCASKPGCMSKRRHMRHVFVRRMAQLFFPNKCIFCGTIIAAEKEYLICESCLQDLYSDRHINAGLTLGSTDMGPAKVRVDGLFCGVEYVGRARNAIIDFKFNGKRFYGKTLAWIFARVLYQWKECFDIIIPVPISGHRLRDRGYNQAEEVGKGISGCLGVSMEAGALRKVRDTPRQSKLKGMQRVDNVAGAFEVINPENIRGRNVLLIDDILTTGSTLGECAGALYKAGANKVYCGALAIAVRSGSKK